MLFNGSATKRRLESSSKMEPHTFNTLLQTEICVRSKNFRIFVPQNAQRTTLKVAWRTTCNKMPELKQCSDRGDAGTGSAASHYVRWNSQLIV